MTDHINNDDLFDNPMVRAAMAAMSEEEQEKYKKIGEQMYGNMNFNDSRYTIDPNAKLDEARECLESQLRSGLHPSDMEDNEKAVLVDSYGDKWYEKWDYVEGDLIDIVTVMKQ